MTNKIVDTLCPKHLTCDLCGKEVFHGEDVCADCKKTLIPVGETYCLKCGRRTTKPYSVCPSCEKSDVDLSRSAFIYDEGIAKLIKRFKYDGRKYLAEVLGEYMAKIYVENYFTPDVITFVPMTARSEFSRGFNHSEELAKYLAKKFDNEVIAVFNKQYDTSHQASLNVEERQKNLKGSFIVADKKAVKGKKILIVDDVLTTGATSGELASLAKKSGAKSVYLLTVASVVLERANGK